MCSSLQNAKVAFRWQRSWVEDEGRLERTVQTLSAARPDRLAVLNDIGREFRTPLNAITGLVVILVQRAEAVGAVIDYTKREYLSHVCDNGGDMLALVEDLMLLAHSQRISAIVLRPCASAELVTDCYGAVQQPKLSQVLTLQQSGIEIGRLRFNRDMVSRGMWALVPNATAFWPTSVTVIAKKCRNPCSGLLRVPQKVGWTPNLAFPMSALGQRRLR